MTQEEFNIKISENLKKNKINLEKLSVETLYKYMKEILDWNEKINLTAIKDESEFIVKHYIDSLLICDFVGDSGNLIDIGTGAGFPGIPVKLAKPELKVTLLDSVSKKINVIREVSKKIKINDLELIHSRVEDIAKNEKYREKYDYVTSRAVSNLTTLAEYMLPLTKIGGISICMKGPNCESEIEKSRKAIGILGGEIKAIKNKRINGDYDRTIIIIKKEKQTPKQYPRDKGKPLKEPLY